MLSLGNRMKEFYENRYRIKLTRKVPVVIRLDGKAFHTLTRGCTKPFDSHLVGSMLKTTEFLCKEIQGAKCAYVQSDEISILLSDFDRIESESWFDYNLQKVVSVSAAMASVKFTDVFGRMAFFDSRAFNIPREDVCNYFVWRQQDWIRNSVQMLAQAHFSHKELHCKNTSDMHEMLFQKGINWADLESVYKNGSFLWLNSEDSGWNLDFPIFTQERYRIDNYLMG